MSNKPKIRTANLIGTGRTSLKLDESAWTAIDMLAAKRGTDWKVWARSLLNANPDASNKAALLRAALTEELKTEQLMAFAETGPVETNTTRDSSFVAFTLLTGYRNEVMGGEPFVIIQNNLRDQLHLMIAPTVD